MKKCVAEKGLDFCVECVEYPCEDLIKFQSLYPHRIELWKFQETIKKAGYKKWFKKTIEHYSCPECRTINSAYNNVCQKCGRSPGCEYVEINNEAINKRMSKRI